MSAPVVYTELARDVRADAFCRLLDGGTLVLLAWDGVEVLARIPFALPAFLPAVDGVAVACPMESAPGLADGKAERWQAFASDGRCLLAGLVGLGESLEISGDVAADGEVQIERFTYEVPR